MFLLNKFIYFFIILILLSFNKVNADEENSASIFVYHRFGENKYPSTNVKMSQFNKHIDELISNNYNVLPLEEIVNSIIEKRKLPEKTIGISIDDAFMSIYENAWPILKNKEIPFTVFVSTGPVNSNSKNYMNWRQIKELSDSGVTIGHHTVNHLHLVDKDKELIIDEIENASNDFMKNLGYVPSLFAYPYGEYNLKIKEITKQYFKASFGQQSGSLYNKIDLYELPRFSMNERYGDIKRFKFAANSHGLRLKDLLPNDKSIKDINPPMLGFTLIDDIENTIKCYPSHGIKSNLTKIGKSRIEVRFDKEFPKGRTRVNCTVNDKGKWRWSGFQFIRP